MKLRNKKTGEVFNFVIKAETYKTESHFKLRTGSGGWEDGLVYDSLGKLNEEWEDYEEPKEVWTITTFGEVQGGSPEEDIIPVDPRLIDKLKEIGNYFETKEEAEKAVEKLKAWKRLKDKGFRFEGLTLSGWGCPCIEYKVDGGISDSSSDMQVREELDLLFGGEE